MTAREVSVSKEFLRSELFKGIINHAVDVCRKQKVIFRKKELQQWGEILSRWYFGYTTSHALPEEPLFPVDLASSPVTSIIDGAVVAKATPVFYPIAYDLTQVAVIKGKKLTIDDAEEIVRMIDFESLFISGAERLRNFSSKNTIEGFATMMYSNQVQKKLLSFYNQEDDCMTYYVEALMIRYDALSSYNNQLALPRTFMKYIEKVLNVNHELFASPFNAYFRTFCSIFPDIELVFGSVGNFFEFNLVDGASYVANPPFDETVITAMATRLIDQLSRVSTTVIVSLPAWDDLEGHDLLVASQYAKQELINIGIAYMNEITGETVKAIKSNVIILSSDPEYQILHEKKIISTLV